MRVYEYAKEHNVSSKDVLEKLKKIKLSLKIHMAVLSQEALRVLQSSAAPKAAPSKPKSTDPKVTGPAEKSEKNKVKVVQKNDQKKQQSTAPAPSSGQKPLRQMRLQQKRRKKMLKKVGKKLQLRSETSFVSLEKLL